MEYNHSEQTNLKYLQGKHFNLVIAASGFEKRSITLIETLEYSADRKVVFAFSERQNIFNRENNDKFFISKGFEFVKASGEDSSVIQGFLSDFFSSFSEDFIEILVDYSCMTRIWYATLINFFSSNASSLKYVSIFFTYTPAGFNLPKKIKPVKIAESLIHKESLNGKTSKPLALVIGLGIEKNKAEYLVKKLNPAQVILLYADPALEKDYVKAVLRNNRELIDSVEMRNLLNYPLEDMIVTTEILTNICLILRMKFNVIIAPVGPKIFSLISILLTTRYPDIDVWRVSSGAGEPLFDRLPANDPLVYKVSFVNDDEDF